LGGESHARAVNSDLDMGVDQNLDAALTQNKLYDRVRSEVRIGVVKLTGDADSQSTRRNFEPVAGSVSSVQQVVNELQVKIQMATSSM
jgi:osmotically-inducible protein OsmY